MFIQIHMLQSMPPGNLNRDESGQPKKCWFGGVTRGRISSQCLKRNIRHWPQFKAAVNGNIGCRTKYLAQMVAEELRRNEALGVPEEELGELIAAIAKRFSSADDKGDEAGGDGGEHDADTGNQEQDAPRGKGKAKKKPQLVFFHPSFAPEVAALVGKFRKDKEKAYNFFIGRAKLPKKEKEALEKIVGESLVAEVAKASEGKTLDIALFGRMTTSNLVVNTEACCQVAHAITTHEAIVECDYFTAKDEKQDEFLTDQTAKAGAAFVSGDSAFFNSGVYYKYLNVDIATLRDKKHLPKLGMEDAGKYAGALLEAAALATPTGKQNSFAAHSAPELILVEISKSKRPISYANAFLQAVKGGDGRNLMTESAKAFQAYVDSSAPAFAPADTQRVLMAVGPAQVELASKHQRADTLDKLVAAVVKLAGADA